MQHLIISLLTGAALTATALGAEKGESKFDGTDCAQVIKFFKENVIGRTLATPQTTYKWDDNKMEGEYQDQVIYNNFTETAAGFTFDVTSVSKQTLYDLDPQGQRLQPGRDFSGTFVLRYEICERTSTKQLTGIARPIAMTIKAPSVEGTISLVTGMKVADGKLIWNETLPGYADFPSAKDKYKPGSWSVKASMSAR